MTLLLVILTDCPSKSRLVHGRKYYYCLRLLKGIYKCDSKVEKDKAEPMIIFSTVFLF